MNKKAVSAIVAVGIGFIGLILITNPGPVFFRVGSAVLGLTWMVGLWSCAVYAFLGRDNREMRRDAPPAWLVAIIVFQVGGAAMFAGLGDLGLLYVYSAFDVTAPTALGWLVAGPLFGGLVIAGGLLAAAPRMPLVMRLVLGCGALAAGYALVRAVIE